ncbi:MAG: hypothetical protein AAF125_16335, partial [Chloroflexota bacterium]
MTEDEKKALVVSDESTNSEDTLAGAMGGYQALVMFAIIAIFAAIVFAFPTPRNPAVTETSTEGDIVATLGEINTAGEDEGDLLDTLANMPETPEGDDETEAVAAAEEMTEEPTVAPTVEPTAEPTAPSTVEPTVEPTIEPTVPPTVEPTVPPTVEPTTEPTEEVTEEPTEEAAADPIAELLASADPANGEALFVQSFETSSGVWMCSSCHSVDEAAVRLVGPPMWSLYANEERVVDSGSTDIVAYTEASIRNPQQYLVP